MKITFAPPTPAEFQALFALTGWGSIDEVTAARALEGSWIVATARNDDGVVHGVGRVIRDGVMHAYVNEMMVHPDSRGGGIGSAIITALVAEARRRGVTRVQLFAAEGRAVLRAPRVHRAPRDRARDGDEPGGGALTAAGTVAKACRPRGLHRHHLAAQGRPVPGSPTVTDDGPAPALIETAAWGAELATALVGVGQHGYGYIGEPLGPCLTWSRTARRTPPSPRACT